MAYCPFMQSVTQQEKYGRAPVWQLFSRDLNLLVKHASIL
jgi:hypothetical protein